MGAWSANFYNDLVRRYGFVADAERVQALYLDGRPADAADALSDELMEAVTVCGSAGYVRDRLAAYREAGVTTFRIVAVDGGVEPELVEQVKALSR